jgi:hypothetical protein
VARKRNAHDLKQECPPRFHPYGFRRFSMAVIIGVDPHKATHTAVAIRSGEQELARKKVRSGGTQAEHLLAWAEPFETRTWAIESAAGLGYLLAQQLVAAGETVLDVPAMLASRALHGPVEQERPQRRLVGRDRGAGVPRAAPCRGARTQ